VDASTQNDENALPDAPPVPHALEPSGGRGEEGEGRESGTFAAGEAACAVKLSIFEGPLDLLLHLIRANEVDIGNIPIALISQQYLEYLELMRDLDIDVAAEYLLMAATLAQIKSRMLLPRDPEEDEAEGLDPRAELARRLAAFAAFKAAAVRLDQRPQLGRDVFDARAEAADVPEREAILQVELVALLDAMKRVLEQLPEEVRNHEVSRERFTVQDRMIATLDALRDAPDLAVLFEDLLRGGELNRDRVIATFLALLELAKLQAIQIYQNIDERGAPTGPIRVRLAAAKESHARDDRRDDDRADDVAGDAGVDAAGAGDGGELDADAGGAAGDGSDPDV
jgi:segregation and condensation protein A